MFCPLGSDLRLCAYARARGHTHTHTHRIYTTQRLKFVPSTVIKLISASDAVHFIS